tara:strand:+ start:422 stop:1075 length:654 start_codon:yes stop_codon:yes gene_type:complete
MEGVPIRIAGLGRIGGRDLASSVTEEANSIGAEVDFIIESDGYEEFDQGLIDWRFVLGNKHWLVLSSDGPLAGDSMKFAWGSSLTFAELEGCKSVMIVGVPSEAERLEEAWGYVIERIRQINILFISNEALEGISKIEDTAPNLLLDEIRNRGAVPIVCTFEPVSGIAEVSHPLGRDVVEVGEGMESERWLAGFLCSLPTSGYGASAIMNAAISRFD